ncbi:MAG TPA: OpgC domain-containing protein [Stellaceae bacterium]|nr:OpgC domain-containing protein [Stellaceae bacterium]
MAATEAQARPKRDLRLDFFRGLALFLIFVDHIPGNFISYFTLRSIGFSDAAEAFIFISGYAASMVYGALMRQHGFCWRWRRSIGGSGSSTSRTSSSS